MARLRMTDMRWANITQLVQVAKEHVTRQMWSLVKVKYIHSNQLSQTAI